MEYADGACHLIGASKSEHYEQADSQAPLATKSCVKVIMNGSKFE